MRSSYLPALVAGALLVLPCWLAATAHAQAEEIGGQRRGTTSLEFLKIGVGARAEGMGQAFVSVANDPSAMYWNPAGIGSILRRSLQVSTVQYPADITYNYLALVLPSSKLGGSLGFQLGGLATDMAETDENHPFGTGRTFTFSDFVIGATYARRFTDKLLLGFGIKYAREDFGSQLDEPATAGLLFDLGSIYYIGFKSFRVGMSLTNFGGDLGPGGTFISQYTKDDNGAPITRSFDTFSAPAMFRYGLAFEPLEREGFRWTTALEASQPSDNAIEFRLGTEFLIANHLALRTGYQVKNSETFQQATAEPGLNLLGSEKDAFGFCAGAGFKGQVAGFDGEVNYAYTDGGPLGHVNRLTLQVAF